MTLLSEHEVLPAPAELVFNTPLPDVTPEALIPLKGMSVEMLVSSPALVALQEFRKGVEDERSYQHPLRVAAILHDFVGERTTQGMYDAAALHDMEQRVRLRGSRQRKLALEALSDYATFMDLAPVGQYPKWKYTSELLADMAEIEQCSMQSRHNDTGDEEVNTLLASRGGGRVPHRAWDIESDLVEMDALDDLTRKINIEAALVKAAEMLDNLQHPAPKARSVLHDVFEAESFYAPLCEAIGYDGLAMAIRSAAAEIRLERSGKQYALDRAAKLLGKLGTHEQITLDVSVLFEHLLGGEAIVETPIHNETGHNIVMGDAVLDVRKLTGAEKTSWVRWRLKSLGSLALKYVGTETVKDPMDVLAATIIVETEEELAMTYKAIVECIKANRVVEARPAPSREQAFSVQGSDTYREKVVTSALESTTIERADIHELPKYNGHQVAKANFVSLPHMIDPEHAEEEIPVELMVQTYKDWKESREGKAAHLFYKAGKFRNAQTLEVIKKRVEFMGSEELNPASHERGENFRKLIARHTLKRAMDRRLAQAA